MTLIPESSSTRHKIMDFFNRIYTEYESFSNQKSDDVEIYQDFDLDGARGVASSSKADQGLLIDSFLQYESKTSDYP